MDGVVEEAGQRPEEGGGDLRQVVEVPRDAPPAGGEEQAGAGLAGGGGVLGGDVLRLAAPHQRLPVRRAEHLALAVRVVVHPDAGDAGGGHGEGGGGPQGHGVRGEVQHGAGVHAGHPAQAPPAQVVPRAVVLDVHAVPVPRLPQEELRDVRQHDDDGHHDGVRHGSVQLLLLDREAKDDVRPGHHAETTVGERLKIQRTNTRIQLHAPVEIVEGRSAGAIVGA
mmetsp:Transcript_22126/g.48565  ORF Transcript_22126/g.48565 Transcript_22126/m.48565 type:complete len:224 (-) Transcript_22126:737-1408(-)